MQMKLIEADVDYANDANDANDECDVQEVDIDQQVILMMNVMSMKLIEVDVDDRVWLM